MVNFCIIGTLILSLQNIFTSLKVSFTTVNPKAAFTSEWPSLSCARFTCDIYASFFLLSLKNEEVEKLWCKLSGYMWEQFALDTNPSTDGQLFVVFTGNSKHRLNQELDESSYANPIRCH